MPDAEQWSEPVTVHGEGPIWNPLLQRFQLVDMLEGDVLTLHDGEVTDRLHVDTVAATIRPRLFSGLLVAGERDVILIDTDGTHRRIEGPPLSGGVRFNEGSCAPDGSFWVGTMAYDATPGAGVIVRLDPGSLTFTQVAQGLTISNGLAFDRNEHAFFVDSVNPRIDRLTLRDAAIAAREPWVDLDGVPGVPDGICLDAEGGVWVAMFGGGCVRRYGPTGELTDVINVPTEQVTACTLGGRNGTDLLITTSRLGLGSNSGYAGAAFLASVGVPSAVSPLFGG